MASCWTEILQDTVDNVLTWRNDGNKEKVFLTFKSSPYTSWPDVTTAMADNIKAWAMPNYLYMSLVAALNIFTCKFNAYYANLNYAILNQEI